MLRFQPQGKLRHLLTDPEHMPVYEEMNRRISGIVSQGSSGGDGGEGSGESGVQCQAERSGSGSGGVGSGEDGSGDGRGGSGDVE